MPIAQVTLTVEESKVLIAQAVSIHPKVKESLEKGGIFLKGGSTVSQVAKIITGERLEVCGIITGRGTVINEEMDENLLHIALYKGGKLTDIDKEFDDNTLRLTEKDLIICGVNAIDVHGNAAMMVGSPDGGNTPSRLSAWLGEGVSTIIPVGLEKLVPGNINMIIKETGRKKKAYSTGMAIGLVPVLGEIITEIEAIELLFGLKARMIGAGGLAGGRGSVTLDILGEKKELKDFMGFILKLKEETLDFDDFKECQPVCIHCREHLGCLYKRVERK